MVVKYWLKIDFLRIGSFQRMPTNKSRIEIKNLSISSEINKKVRNRRTKKKKKSKVGNTLSKQIIPRIRRKILFSQNFLIVSD